MRKLFLVSAAFSLLMGSAWGQTVSEIDKALDQMKSSGMFSDAQIEAARKQMGEYDDAQMHKLIQNAKARANDPKVKAMAEKIMKGMQDKQSGRVPSQYQDVLK